MNEYLYHANTKNTLYVKHDRNKDNELLELLQDSPEFQKNIECLSYVYSQLFDTEYPKNYCYYTDEEQQCSDGSDLYTLIKYEGKDVIVKVGEGAFNTKVFTTGNIKELKGFYYSPIPLFVVNQYHSCMCLSNKKEVELSKKKPKEYLNAYAVIVYPRHKEAYYRKEKERYQKPIDYTHINIRHYSDALSVGRLALLKQEFPNGEFEKAIYILKRLKMMSFDEFYKQIWKGRNYVGEETKRLLECFWRMGMNTTDAVVGDKEAFMSLYELIQSFDVHKEIFVSSQY